MNLDQSIKLSPDVISQEVSGETVILDLASEFYFGLDEVGTRIWQLIRESGNLRAIHHQLLEEYGVTDEQLRADLHALISEASRLGLVELGPTVGIATS